MKPVGKNILFKPFPSIDKSEGGLFVPDAFKKENNKGEIVEVGHSCKKVKKGQVGFRVQYWGDEIIINGQKHYLMNEDAILATI